MAGRNGWRARAYGPALTEHLRKFRGRARPHLFIPGLDTALRSTIESFHLAMGKREVLMRLERRPLWGLAARGDTVLFSQADRDSSDLMIIDPFLAP